MTHPSAKHGAYRPWAVRTVVVRLSRKLTATYRLRSGRVLSRLLAAMLAGFSTLATALPEGASLVAGQANISTPNANAMVVTQGSDKAILNWQSFNIGTGQSMQFVQPGAASVALNRVVGAAPSSIYGSLSANGQVFLINPAGVMFAPGAQVHVGGLVASTLALSNEDFMAGRYTFSSSGNAGIVTNGGNIRAARGGYVLLAAPGVSNTGAIQADGGAVGLVAGSRVSIDTSGVGLVSFSVDAAAANAVASNSGVITANGGQVAVLASALGDAMATVVNQTGVIRATSATERNGMIVLSGGRSGVVHVAGTLDASGVATGQTGGTVQVLGDKVVLATGAAIDVSGNSGGGTALVGGDYQGTNASVQNASYTHMAAGSQIRADALESGNGGKVVLWANEATVFEGAITARGGSLSGNGGLVETSGKEFLRATGSVDASGVQGTGGVWLLDPRNVSIVNGASSGGTFVSPTYTPTADNAIADRNQLEAALNGGTSVNVVTGGTGTQAGNITVVDSITKSSGAAATLTLTAAGSMFVNNAISSTSNALNVNLSASAATTFGASGSLVTNGGNVAITGTGAKTLGSIDTTGGTGTGNLSVGSSGAVSQLGATSLAIKGTTGITAGATNNVTLNNAGNDFAGAVSVTTGLNVGITDANALILGTSTVSGTLGINTSGAITQTGALAVTGAATLAAGAGNDITLTNAANNFASVGITSGNNAALTDSNAIVLNGSTLATSLTVRAGGAITQSAAITAPTLNATTLINAGAAITLTNAGNEVDTVNLRARNLADSANVAGATAYTDASAIGVAAAQSLSTVTLLAGGAISQTGAIVASTLTATTANAAGAAITLTNAGNNAATVNLQARDGTAAAPGAANANAAIQYTDSNAVAVSGINSGTGAGGDVTLLAGGAITQTGAIKANTLTATTANATAGTGLITLTNAGNTASTVNLQARAGTVAAVGAANVASTIQYTGAGALGISGINSGTGAGGNVTLIAGGPITQSGAIKAGILTATTADAAGSAITLTDTANDAVTVNLQARTGTAAAPGLANASAAIQYTDSNVVAVSGINNGTGVGGDVTLIAGGAITQSGAIKAGTLSAKTLNDTPAAITLANAGNDAASIILQTRNSADSDRTAAAISYTDANAVVVGGINAGTGSAATGNLALVAAGAITQTGAVIVGGTTGITAGATNDVTLSNAANDFTGAVSIVSGRHVNINDANALVLGTITTTGAASSDGGNVQITAGGSVTTGTITTTGGTAGTNSVGRNAGSVNITAGGALSVGAISAGGSAGNGANQTGGGGGAVTLTSTGGNVSAVAITTTGGNGVAGVASGGNAGTITLEAAGGTPTITLAGNLSAVGGAQFGG
ncbi:filamentous hemagglutinin N-terminal domain-containing protein, partial [Polaromonas sp. YR568]|uniref:beta strand repeat-containing protein n=1 Tax=Polaromonas sp. YR568 TaxID=1855301 RepID=UPI003137E715